MSIDPGYSHSIHLSEDADLRSYWQSRTGVLNIGQYETIFVYAAGLDRMIVELEKLRDSRPAPVRAERYTRCPNHPDRAPASPASNLCGPCLMSHPAKETA